MYFDLYNRSIIEILLDSYYTLTNQSYHLKLDLERALQSTQIDGQMRLLIFLKFGLNFNVMQILETMHLDYNQYEGLLYELYETIEAILNGYHTTREPFSETTATTFEGYIFEVQTKHVNPYNWKRLDGLMEHLAMFHDDLALSVLNLKMNGMDSYNENNTGKYLFDVADDDVTKNKIQIRNATVDEFYRQDLKNSVFYGDDSLLLAELESKGVA